MFGDVLKYHYDRIAQVGHRSVSGYVVNDSDTNDLIFKMNINETALGVEIFFMAFSCKRDCHVVMTDISDPMFTFKMDHILIPSGCILLENVFLYDVVSKFHDKEKDTDIYDLKVVIKNSHIKNMSKNSKVTYEVTPDTFIENLKSFR